MPNMILPPLRLQILGLRGITAQRQILLRLLESDLP